MLKVIHFNFFSAMLLLSLIAFPNFAYPGELYNIHPYFSIGLFKSSNLGSFEPYLFPNLAQNDKNTTNIASSFRPSSKPGDIKVSMPRGFGILGRVGIEHSLRIESQTLKMRYGILAFSDTTSIEAQAPTGWAPFLDPINALASNNVGAFGLFAGTQLYENLSGHFQHEIFVEAGLLQVNTISKLKAVSESLDVQLNDRSNFTSPIVIVEYGIKPGNKSDMNLIIDLITFASPNIIDVGLSVGIKRKIN